MILIPLVLNIRRVEISQSTFESSEILFPSQQALSAVYALGLRDGLQIAADIRDKTQNTKGDT